MSCPCLCHPCACCQTPMDQACGDCADQHVPTRLSRPEPNHIVLRPGPGCEGRLPDQLDGLWIDLTDVPHWHGSGDQPLAGVGPGGGFGVAKPTGRFEVRESDGAVAEVWEIEIRENPR